MPRISVIVSVYNCEEFIGETVESIINQTYKDWELIIIDDNSRDKSAEVIECYAKQDERIRFIRNTENQGQCANLNTAIRVAKGEFIAHTDHDDVSYPERLEKQLAFMEANPSCVLCGCRYDVWTDGKIVDTYGWDYCSLNEFRFTLPMVDRLAHSTFFWKRAALVDNDIYYGEWDYAEDYDLLLRALCVGEIGLAPEVLMYYRDFSENTTHTIDPSIITREINTIRKSFIEKTKDVDKEIWLKVEDGKAKTRDDLKRWDMLMESYAKACGVTNKSLLKEINWMKYCLQKPSMVLAISYICSKYRGSLRNVAKLVKLTVKENLGN